MILELGALLVAVLGQPGQDDGVITTSHVPVPSYHRHDYKAACGSNVFRVRFQNGPDEHGRVKHMTVDGRPVRGAAEHLQLLAARRPIERIGIRNCGSDERRPEFQAVMDLSEMASKADKLRPSVHFVLRKQEDGRWQILIY